MGVAGVALPAVQGFSCQQKRSLHSDLHRQLRFLRPCQESAEKCLVASVTARQHSASQTLMMFPPHWTAYQWRCATSTVCRAFPGACIPRRRVIHVS